MGIQLPTDAALLVSDVTTNNASTTAHGFQKKLSGVVGDLQDGVGNWATPLIQHSFAGNPTGTTSTSDVMMGLGIAFTPTRSGRITGIAFLNAANNTLGDGVRATVYSGTGTAPTNGAAVTGTQRSGSKDLAVTPAANFGVELVLAFGPFTATAGVALWFDIAVRALTGGTATISSIDILLIEL